MRIGIDARLYSESGVGRYIRNLINNLSLIDSKNDYFIFLLKKNLDIKLPKNFIKIETDIGWYGITEQIKLPKIINSYKLDIVHFPHFNVPLLYRGKFIVTIHDLIHQHYQMRRATTRDPITYQIKHLGYITVFKNAVRHSQVILTPSNFVKQQLMEIWKIKGEKIKVTSEGVDQLLLNILKKSSKKTDQKILDKYKIQPSFIFYVGNAHPHKNIEGLIKVFFSLRKRHQYLQLVLSGHDHYFWERVRQEFKHRDIIYTGFVSDQELATLYKNAKAFVLPSFEEGFGIPVLEAFAASCPVVSSNSNALQEVGGNAAIYFNPRDLEDMEQKISQVLNSQKLRQQLIIRGQKRYKKFSWQRMAEQTLKLYQLEGP